MDGVMRLEKAFGQAFADLENRSKKLGA